MQKESAAIRASFREEAGDQNVRCVELALPLHRYLLEYKLTDYYDTQPGEIMLRSSSTYSHSVSEHILARLSA